VDMLRLVDLSLTMHCQNSIVNNTGVL